MATHRMETPTRYRVYRNFFRYTLPIHCTGKQSCLFALGLRDKRRLETIRHPSANDPPRSATRVLTLRSPNTARVDFLESYATPDTRQAGKSLAVHTLDRASRMSKTVHYALVAFWEKSGCKIVADHPATQDPVFRTIALSTVDGLKYLENDKISLDRGKYTVHVLIRELHYVCLTSKPDSPVTAASLESRVQVFLEKLRSVYRELPILADLSTDLSNLAVMDLSDPLKKIIEEYNRQEIDIIPRLEGELAEIRKALMDGVQKLIDRGESLDELVRKTQSLQIMSRKDFHMMTRTSGKKRGVVAAAAAAGLMFVSTSLFILLLYIGIL
ncbi:uncharacterized protein LOC143150075 [Ptiloglossa arizonensis]|uniref:uncharacterized protein LOC143150075 n=1 Tax=Ptiloglossa arizonensis TaxID=3350558 RepID=UPI003F9FD1D8